MSITDHETDSQDPRIDLALLREYSLTLDSSWPKKMGYPVFLDGQKIGEVWQTYKYLATFGRDAPKAWFRRDSGEGDPYDSPLEAAQAMATDLLLNRLPPGQTPLTEKWEAERRTGTRMTMNEFYAWAAANNFPYRKPGVPLPEKEARYLTL